MVSGDITAHGMRGLANLIATAKVVEMKNGDGVIESYRRCELLPM